MGRLAAYIAFHTTTTTTTIEFRPFVFKIQSGNKILTSVKGHNFVTNLQVMTGNIQNPELVHINAHTKFGQILSIYYKDIERKRNTGINQLCYKFTKNDR